jgi:hypothetical protein
MSLPPFVGKKILAGLYLSLGKLSREVYRMEGGKVKNFPEGSIIEDVRIFSNHQLIILLNGLGREKVSRNKGTI